MQKPKLNWVLLYVENTLKSAAFYSNILGIEPAEPPKTGDDFVMYMLPGGWTLGLWNKDEVEPPATRPGGAEVSFTEATPEDVRTRYAEWTAAGVRMAQEPVQLDFGLTFTALDPDGHRLRVFAPAR